MGGVDITDPGNGRLVGKGPPLPDFDQCTGHRRLPRHGHPSGGSGDEIAVQIHVLQVVLPGEPTLDIRIVGPQPVHWNIRNHLISKLHDCSFYKYFYYIYT